MDKNTTIGCMFDRAQVCDATCAGFVMNVDKIVCSRSGKPLNIGAKDVCVCEANYARQR